MKTETCKLYSNDFWIFLPNIVKINRYNFALYRFKVDSFFWDTVYIQLPDDYSVPYIVYVMWLIADECLCVCFVIGRTLLNCWCTWNFLTSHLHWFIQSASAALTPYCDASTPSDSPYFCLDQSRRAATPRHSQTLAGFTSVPSGTRRRCIGATGSGLPARISTSHSFAGFFSVICRCVTVCASELQYIPWVS